MNASNEASRTDWSLLHMAAGDGAEREGAWTLLTRRYWPAIFAYVRASGHSPEAAAEITQAFVCDVMVHRGLVKGADPSRGRFRGLLMQALRNYLVDLYRKESARRHHEPQAARPVIDDSNLPDTDRAQRAFTLAFVASMVRKVTEDVKRDLEASGRAAHWTLFQARVLRPLMTGARPAPYGPLARSAGVQSASQAANMVLQVKRRFARAMAAEIAATVGGDADPEDELYALLRDVEVTQ